MTQKINENSKYCDCGQSDFTEYDHDDDTFEIGVYSDKKAAVTLKCKTCGGKEFAVGSGSYYTAISCLKCGWQTCVHEG